MKLSIERSHLFTALSHVQSVVEKRNTLPILQNILLRADADGLHLTATDLDIEAVDRAAADVDRPGELTAPAAMLFDVVRKLPSGSDIEIERDAESSQLILRSGASRYSLSTLPASDFQTMDSGADGVSFSVDGADLRRLIDKTRFAISTEETRHYLNGIYLHSAERDGEAVLRSVATDGHRLALAEMPLPLGAEDLEGVIIPRKAVTEARRMMDGFDGEILLTVSAAKVRVKAGDAQLTAKLIDGAFPDYARVIPQNNSRALQVPNAAFKTAVDRVSTVSTERSRSVKMSMDDNRLGLTVTQSEQGMGSESLDAMYEDEALEIGFNASYLVDIANQIESDEARFLFADPASPALVTDPDDKNALYVLMPLRV